MVVVLFIVFLSVFLLPFCRTVSDSNHPNIIVLLADDFGWGDLGANWPETRETPHLDALARQGIRFTDFHAGASVCSPSRAALLTGRLGARNGVTKNFGIDSTTGLPLNETTIAEMVKTVNYSTGMVGKWHLGVYGHYHPYYRGFDFYFGLPYSNDMGCVDKPGYDLPPCKPCPLHLDHEDGVFATHQAYPCQMQDNDSVPLYHQTQIVEQPADLNKLSEKYVQMAVQFINSQDNRPFFLYVAFAHTHVPLNHEEKYTNASYRKTAFADTLLEMDATVGAIIQALKDHGIEDNTLVWFAGDNGPWEEKCQYSGLVGPYLGLWEKNASGGSSAKGTTWEGGHREPGIVYWPGKISPRVSNALVSTLDILPTVAAISGAKLPQNRIFDGIDISHILFDDSDEGHHFLFHPNSRSGTPGAIDTIRYKDYKAMYQTGAVAACGKQPPPPVRHDPPLLFNLRHDPAERKPLNVSVEPQAQIMNKILYHLEEMHQSLQNDNTSNINYTSSPSARPCCDIDHVVCRCTN
jgi:arylsulfatase G